MATANKVLHVVAAAVVEVADLYEHTYPEKTVLLDVRIIRIFMASPWSGRANRRMGCT